jgi:hypothetical protein
MENAKLFSQEIANGLLQLSVLTFLDGIYYHALSLKERSILGVGIKILNEYWHSFS